MTGTRIERASAELWRYTLETPVGGSGVAAVDVIVVDLATGDGLSARGFSYVLGAPGTVPLAAARQLLAAHVEGQPLGHPEAAAWRMRAALNRLGRGPAFIGMAAIDVALWDLYARSLGVPVGIAMGGAPRRVPVYGSGGFNTTQSPAEAAANAAAYRAQGISAVKPRVSGAPADSAVVTAVADAVGAGTTLMLDANEKGTLASATRLLALAGEYNALFVEEPVAAYELAAYRALARAAPVAIATGEHLQGLAEAQTFVTGGLCRVFQPDLAMMGGLTECLRVTRLAEAHGVEIAPHFLPSVFVHLAAVAPNVTWLEDFPLLEPLFGSPATFEADGTLGLPDTPGLGLAWDEDARKRYRVDA